MVSGQDLLVLFRQVVVPEHDVRSVDDDLADLCVTRYVAVDIDSHARDLLADRPNPSV